MSESKGISSELKVQLNRETAKINWLDLQSHFARGVVFVVNKGLDLIDVAVALSEDNKAQVQAWMESSELAQVADSQAQEWFENNAVLWAVVVRPWILVQSVD